MDKVEEITGYPTQQHTPWITLRRSQTTLHNNTSHGHLLNSLRKLATFSCTVNLSQVAFFLESAVFAFKREQRPVPDLYELKGEKRLNNPLLTRTL